MKTASPSSSRLISPDPDQARQAREAARRFAGMAATARGSQSLRLIPEGRDAPPVEVPEPAFRLFLEILNQMAQGNPVTIVPMCGQRQLFLPTWRQLLFPTVLCQKTLR